MNTEQCSLQYTSVHTYRYVV